MPTAIREATFDRLPEKIETARLLLEQLRLHHVTETYLSWFRDDEVVRFLEARDLDRQQVIEHFENGERSGEYRVYAIRWKETSEHVGNLKLGPINWRHGYADLVTVIGDRRAWGKGLAAEAITAGNNLAFESLGLRKLSGSIYGSNVGSLRTYTKSGWVVEGVLKAHLVIDGMPVDRILVSCFNPAYFDQSGNPL